MASSGGLTDKLSKNVGRFIQERTKALLTIRGKKKIDVCGILPTGFCLQNSAPVIDQRIVEIGKNDGPGRNASTT